jgi:predicted transcriptional regulator
MRRERRDRFDIIKDVLELCLDRPLMKTAIMYKAKLSYAQIEEFLSFCVTVGLLKNQIVGSRVVYITTQKGMKLIDMLNQVKTLLKKEEVVN